MTGGLYTTISPVAQIMQCCVKYNLLNHVTKMVQMDDIVKRLEWKRFTYNIIMDNERSMWRCELKMYKHLDLFRTIVTSIEPCVWWRLAKIKRSLNRSCVTMIRLLYSCNKLSLYHDFIVDSKDRICKLCELNEVECIYHFIIICPKYIDYRSEMMACINKNVSESTWHIMISLSKMMFFYILMGLELPMQNDDLDMIRTISVFYINRMYQLRNVSMT